MDLIALGCVQAGRVRSFIREQRENGLRSVDKITAISDLISSLSPTIYAF